MYALLESGAVKQYPYTYEQLKATQPNTSWPVSMSVASLADYNVVPVVATGRPPCDYTQTCTEATPTFNADRGRWEQTWSVAPATPSEEAQRQQQIQDEIVTATQQRLDDFAKTRNYDGILSAATYATSPTTKFYTEGQYAVNCRDATWSALYSILAEVQAGTRPMPSSYADIEAELPVLEWSV